MRKDYVQKAIAHSSHHTNSFPRVCKLLYHHSAFIGDTDLLWASRFGREKPVYPKPNTTAVLPKRTWFGG